jgi:hypothetical protein
MGIFSSKTRFEDLGSDRQSQFINEIALLLLDSFERWGRFPPGPESLMAIKMRARQNSYKISVSECTNIHELALDLALELRRG